MALLLYMNINKFTDPIRCWSYNPRILCPHFFLPPSYWEVQLALEKPRSSAYSLEFWLQKKKQQQQQQQKRQPAAPAWIQTQSSGGSIRSQKRWGSSGPVRKQPPYSDTPSRLMFPVDCRMVLMIPACCVQQDRFPTCEHGTGLVDFSNATTPLDVKVKQALRGARETLHPA